MIKMISLATGLLLGAAAAHASERDMTCRGPLLIFRGLGGQDADTRTIGSPEQTLCYLRRNPQAEKIVNTACQTELPCIVRVRAEPRDTPSLMPRTWNVLRVYSARTDVPLPRKRPEKDTH